MQEFSVKTKKTCWIGDHLDSHVSQKIGTRAFVAVEQYAYGKRGRPRFKSYYRFNTVEGKTNASGIRLRYGHVKWRGLTLPAIFDRKDKYGVEAHALMSNTAYVRIICRVLRGKRRWYVQLVQKCLPLWNENNLIGDSVVGLDIGPSSIAVVGESDAFLERFCTDTDVPYRKIRRVQRAIDRSRRATNPGKYNTDGIIKPDPKRWQYSKRYMTLRNELAEPHRRMASTRKAAHGNLANRIIAIGKDIRSETLSYKAFQRLFGRSVNKRTPSMAVSIIRRKAERTGGTLMDLATWKLCLSQFCHGCGGYHKKNLSERWHECECGVGPVQRDLYSAFLARHSDNYTLAISQAKQAWSSAESLLRRVMVRLDQAASGKSRLASFGLSRRQSGSHAEDGSVICEVADVVRAQHKCVPESREEHVHFAVRTPCL